MGISVWQLRRPEVFLTDPMPKIALPEDCQLLFVSAHPPSEKDISLFEKILKTMKLNLEQSMYLPPDSIKYLQVHQLKWCWFADCDHQNLPQSLHRLHTIHSCSLKLLESDLGEKKRLWQQIKLIVNPQ